MENTFVFCTNYTTLFFQIDGYIPVQAAFTTLFLVHPRFLERMMLQVNIFELSNILFIFLTVFLFQTTFIGEDLIQREDDKPESVLNRLEIFSAQTKPVLEFYRQMGICADFKGTESKKIWPHVEAHLKTVIN